MSGTNGNGTSGIPFDERMCEQYLFGELSEPEQETFETAYFNDDAFFNRFLAVKDELIDLYHRDELEPDKRRRIEARFLSTEPRRQRLAESRDFIRSVTRIAERAAPVSAPASVKPERESIITSLKRLFTLPALATAGLIVLAIVLFMVSRPGVPDSGPQVAEQKGTTEHPANSEVKAEDTTPESDAGKAAEMATAPSVSPKRPEESEVAINPRPDVPPAETQAPVPERSVDPTQPQTVPKPTPEAQVAEVKKPEEPKPEITGDRTESVTLSSSSRSATRRNTASIGSATRSVVVRLLFGGEAYASYSVRISTLGGQTVWKASNIKIGMNDGAKSLAVTVPAGSLTRKDYIVVLEGRSGEGSSETIREYYLHVDRQ
jgi:outer membrane biosynthesis protein TonB